MWRMKVFVRYWHRYAMLTVTVVLSEKVDTTVMRSILRVMGTLIGGGVGTYYVLSSPVRLYNWS